MLFTRLYFAAFAGVLFLFFVYINDTTYNYTRHHIFPSSSHSHRPPYPPAVSRPNLNDTEFLTLPPLVYSDTHWPEAGADASQIIWSSRANSIKEAFRRAYNSYEKYAPFPADELQPVSNRSIENFNGWGVTMVDSLDTMLLLGLEDEFQHALSQVASIDFRMPHGGHAPFFETVIRYLGGFLSAYALSKEPILLSRAEDLAIRLLPAFNTTSGLPIYGINTESGDVTRSYTMYFAEIATCQMEFKYLAHLTGRKDFFTKVDRVMDLMVQSQSDHGMWPISFYVGDGKPTGAQYSVGAFEDSAYEYLLKQYLLSGKTEHRLAQMYMQSMTGIIENLLFLSHTRNLLYVTDTSSADFAPSRRFEHLSCFFPGLLALGVDTLPSSVMTNEQRELHKWAAEGLAHSCWVLYADQPSGLGPEIITFESRGSDWQQEKWMNHVRRWKEEGKKDGKPPGVANAGMPVKVSEGAQTDYIAHTPSYLLRPETLESMFVLYRTTNDTKWRERGWQIWEAIETKTRTPSGYTSVVGVQRPDPLHEDSMPSYFLAETIKYAYLLAIDGDPWPVDSYVLNTEAHPFPVFYWREWERKRLGMEEKEFKR
ncbi:glycoside hydrolase family 47 protein [Ramaria rubella]|nr:glycoside hydrolase family 47 protein [Ramaria rubella]